MIYIEKRRLPPDALHGVYKEMVQLVGIESMKILYEHYKGQQITFPVRLYSKQYVERVLITQYDGTNAKELSRELGYSERWIKALIRKLQDESRAK